MRIVDEISFAADLDSVVAMLADPKFALFKCERMRSTQHTAEVDLRADGGFTMTFSRTLATDRFPPVAKRFVGAHVVVVQTDAWHPAAADGSRRGRTVVEIAGRPVAFSGDLRLARLGTRTVQHVDGELRARIPFVGHTLEHLAEPVVRAAIQAEGTIGREWLGERRTA